MPQNLSIPSAAKGELRGRLAAQDSTRRAKQRWLSKAVAATSHRRNDLLPKLTLEYRDPRSLIVPTRNVRGAEAGHIRKVANAISSLGFAAPVLIDGSGNLIDGVVRVEAAKLHSLPLIPCIVIDGLTPSELKCLRLALNRLGEANTWNLDDLKLEFEELILDDAPIEFAGFGLEEIDGILSEVEPQAVEEGPLAPEEGQQAIARPGDIFLLGKHRVICGDAREPLTLFRLLPNEKVRVVFTDQPYNVPIAGHVTGGDHREFAMASGEMSEEGFQAFNEAWIAQAERYLVDGGMLATFIDWRGLGSVTAAAMAAFLVQINLVVWTKTNAGQGSLYRSHHELLPLFKKGDAPHVNNVRLGRHGRWRSNSWTYPGASSVGSDARRGLQDHPTVKPVVMLADALLDLTNRGEIVLDPFLGSGSTLIAAEKTGRTCRGVEIDPLYIDLIVRRFEAVTGTLAILEETGETFSALAARRSEPVMAPAEAATPMTHAVPTSAGPVYRKRTRPSAIA